MKSTIIVKPKVSALLLARAKVGYSTLDLAKAAGVHYTTIHSIEAGRSKVILPKTAKRLADALNKPIEDLFGLEVGVINHVSNN